MTSIWCITQRDFSWFLWNLWRKSCEYFEMMKNKKTITLIKDYLIKLKSLLWSKSIIFALIPIHHIFKTVLNLSTIAVTLNISLMIFKKNPWLLKSIWCPRISVYQFIIEIIWAGKVWPNCNQIQHVLYCLLRCSWFIFLLISLLPFGILLLCNYLIKVNNK